MFAILAALPLETDLLRARLSPCEVRRCGRRDLLLGTLHGQRIALLHTGVGKSNAAAATTALLEHYPPSAILLTGCAGAYAGSGLAVGDLALASEEIFGDEGVITAEGFLDMAALGLPLTRVGEQSFFNRFPLDQALRSRALPLIEAATQAAHRRLASGAFITVSSCSGTLHDGSLLGRRWGGLCENMEGAAVAQTCALYGVPLLEVRGISNLVEDRDLSRWDLRGAARLAQTAVESILSGWAPSQEPA
jgi:futalosine hydrolase